MKPEQDQSRQHNAAEYIGKQYKKRARRTSADSDYINNKEFSAAVIEHARSYKHAVENNHEPPILTDYIAKCIFSLCDRLSRSPNFKDYPYREDFVMDAVENCIAKVHNFDSNAETRSGSPNAFGYFTQIAWFAFVRRINKEKAVIALKQKIINQASLGSFIEHSEFGDEHQGDHILERTRQRNEFYYEDRETAGHVEHTPKKVLSRKEKTGPLDSFV